MQRSIRGKNVQKIIFVETAFRRNVPLQHLKMTCSPCRSSSRLQILYSRIAIALWKSSRGLERHIALQNTTSSSYSNNFHRKPSSKYEKRAVGVTESQVRN